MPKNIVVFSDGTGQEGGLREEQRLSTVYRLSRVCRGGPERVAHHRAADPDQAAGMTL